MRECQITKEDTYYGDGLNLYQYCANNPVRYKDPSGHGSKERSPYKRYLAEGVAPVAVDIAEQMYPNLASKMSIVDKYKAQGYKAADALELTNRELVFGAEKAAAHGAEHMTTTPTPSNTTQTHNANSAEGG